MEEVQLIDGSALYGPRRGSRGRLGAQDAGGEPTGVVEMNPDPQRTTPTLARFMLPRPSLRVEWDCRVSV